ncbi:MAG: lysophospholipid acyltransferase family protein [Candidatus Paceibacterota bacterium]|jgi:1-acyl-sn-glycerol-3-phosphate acyltransferase|nr:1-acyl-sn-glycerol-3-phosphate acyltransferase [bacterium]
MNKITSIFCKIFLAPIVSILLVKKIYGKNNFPKRNFILASNHQSYLDIIVSAYVCVPKRFTFIGQVDKGKGLLRFLRDFFYFFGGVIPLNRFSEDSKKEAVDLAIDCLKRGYSLIIYPEGKRSIDGKINKGKWGVAKLFLQTGVPIVPASISGAFELFPPKGKLRIKRNVLMNIGKPMFFAEELEKVKGLDIDSDEYKRICIQITDKLMESIKQLAYENK